MPASTGDSGDVVQRAEDGLRGTNTVPRTAGIEMFKMKEITHKNRCISQ